MYNYSFNFIFFNKLFNIVFSKITKLSTFVASIRIKYWRTSGSNFHKNKVFIFSNYLKLQFVGSYDLTPNSVYSIFIT